MLTAPSQADIRPLLASQSLSDSLLLLATHAPPPLDPHPLPTVRILQLPAPVEELGALHLVSLLERAKHVVEGWRTRRSAFGDNRIAVLTERFPGGDFALAAVNDAAAMRYPSPSPSFSNVRHSRILPKRKSIFSASTLSLPSTKTQSSQRIFDAIINFLPASMPEKDILKHSILVTSLSVPFLTCNQFPPLPTFDHSKRRFSSFLRSRHTPDDPDASRVPTISHPHLVHILPSRTLSPSSSSASLSPSRGTTPSPSNSARSLARTPLFISRHPPPLSSSSLSPTATLSHKKPKLAQTLEQFLLSFARPTLPTPATDLPGTIPYLLAPGVIGSPAQGRYEGEILTVGEAILLGFLDVCAKGEDVGKSLKSVAGLSTRAWIGDARQVVLQGVDDALSPAIVPLPPLTVPVPARSPSGREKERDGSSESPTMTLTLNHSSSPTTRSSSPQSDISSIKKPAAVAPRIPVSIITPPIGSDDSCNGLVTPPDGSAENGGTEYETCETYASARADIAAHLKAVKEPGPYDPYHNAFFDPDWSRVDGDFGVLAVNDAPSRKKGFFTGFKSLSKAVSMTGIAGQRRSVRLGELRPVVV